MYIFSYDVFTIFLNFFKGYLLRRGYLLPTLKEYWFVLQPHELNYYKGRDERDLCGSIAIDPRCRVETINAPPGKDKVTWKTLKKIFKYSWLTTIRFINSVIDFCCAQQLCMRLSIVHALKTIPKFLIESSSTLLIFYFHLHIAIIYNKMNFVNFL